MMNSPDPSDKPFEEDAPPIDTDFMASFFQKTLGEGVPSLVKEITEIDARYLVQDVVSEGNSKIIYCCEDLHTGRLIAKACLKDSGDEASIENFFREARITSLLQHPNIIPVHDIGFDAQGVAYFTMKLVEGETLGTYLRRNWSTSKEAQLEHLEVLLDIFIKVCDAVAYAHSKGVIHLDLKPDNIQISNYGEVLLCDWGLAKVIMTEESDEKIYRYSLSELISKKKTMDGYVKGTPGYMPPEQIQPRKMKRDQRSDIFALGAILYEMLTKEKIIKHSSVNELLDGTLKGEIINPKDRKFDRFIPAGIAAVAMKALNRDANERYQLVEEMILEVSSYRRGFATEAENANLLKVGRLFFQRNKKSALTAILAFTIIFFSSLIFVMLLKDSKDAAVKAEHKVRDAMINLNDSKEELREQLYWSALYFYEKKQWQKAISQLEDLDKPRAQYLKSKIYFIMHNFTKATENIDKINNEHTDYKRLLKNLPTLLADNEYSIERFFKFNNALNFDAEYKKLFINYHFKHFDRVDNPGPDRTKKLIELLKKQNGIPLFGDESLKITIKKTDFGLDVDLSNNLKISDINVLQYFPPIVKLNLNNTIVTNVSHLKDHPLEELSTDNSRVIRLGILANCPLKTISLKNIIDQVRGLHLLKELETVKLSPKDNYLAYKDQLPDIEFKIEK